MAGQDLFGNEIPDSEEFKLPDGTSINELQLKNADEETQTDAMRVWFYSQYEDPANETPYTSEDGYVYVYGGPYDAKEVLAIIARAPWLQIKISPSLNNTGCI
jgi:hypothetical protein